MQNICRAVGNSFHLSDRKFMETRSLKKELSARSSNSLDTEKNGCFRDFTGARISSQKLGSYLNAFFGTGRLTKGQICGMRPCKKN